MVGLLFREMENASETFPFVVVDGFPKSHPDVEHTEAATDPAHETAGNNSSQRGMGQQQMVVSPLRAPWKNDQQHPHYRADKYKQKHGQPMQPEVESRGGSTSAIWQSRLCRPLRSTRSVRGNNPRAGPTRSSFLGSLVLENPGICRHTALQKGIDQTRRNRVLSDHVPSLGED